MASQPPAKRRRADLTDDTSPEPKSPTLYERGEPWLEDGNVVLVAEGTAYRVLRSILSKNSEVFRDMFMIPQPAEAETFAGCLVVHLSDSKKDVSFLLSVLFGGGAEGYRYGKTIDITVLISMLRMGSKYQVGHLREDTIVQLRQWFPSGQTRFFRESVWSSRHKDTNPQEIPLDDSAAICLINILQECDLDTFIPFVFFHCAQLDTDTLVEGYVDPDGTRWKLSRADLSRCLKGQLWLRQMTFKRYDFLNNQLLKEVCAYRDSCTFGSKDTVKKIKAKFLALTPELRTHPAKSKWELESTYSGLCSFCRFRLQQFEGEFISELWNNLASCFDIAVPWPPADE